ncbi:MULTISPECIES: aspartyl-phosphate phosphatase Spo0E family protein [Clostridium]|jgi:hypothetical protein|uniref:aspartyl-phosphate phosphatase Spo0E family protein n=1 Tax=Clostridium TaxID=1485 RepID=UPI000289AC6C|nr:MULTISPECIES: aspartyl-phosphate phosphatase Spo0E family protein [Clostridium]MDF2504342.1 Spo0E like sporulation regulatory protein [Clostridium sp.]
MLQIEKIAEKIEDLRSLMYQLMNEKVELTDPELVDLSQNLDKLLNKYNELLIRSR